MDHQDMGGGIYAEGRNICVRPRRSESGITLGGIIAKAQNEETAQEIARRCAFFDRMTEATRAVVEAIAAERLRQIEVEGFDARSDDKHGHRGELAQAAACYALASCFSEIQRAYGMPPTTLWPVTWSKSWFKLRSPRRDLEKAAALIVAEIERLDRAEVRSVAEQRDA